MKQKGAEAMNVHNLPARDRVPVECDTLICDQCAPDTPRTWRQWNNRRDVLTGPNVQAVPCLSCGSCDYILATIHITEPFPNGDDFLTRWVISSLSSALVVTLAFTALWLIFG